MATTTIPQKFDILKKYSNEFIISIDKDFRNDLYTEYIEGQEMQTNHKQLTQRYKKSLDSGYGMKI